MKNNLFGFILLFFAMMSCTKVTTPSKGTLPLITISEDYDYARYIGKVRVFSDTLLVGDVNVIMQVNLAAINGIEEAWVKLNDQVLQHHKTIGYEANFEWDTLYAFPNENTAHHYEFIVKDLEGNTSSREIKINHIEAFKLFPFQYSSNNLKRKYAFDLDSGTIINGHNAGEDLQCDLGDFTTPDGAYLYYSLGCHSNSKTLICRDNGFNFYNASLAQNDLKLAFKNGTTTISPVQIGDILIAKLRGTDEYAIVKVRNISNSSVYNDNFYMLEYRKP